ncbi:glutamine synthetase family protein [Streptomyces pseudovenezuelae]|uniref:Glutamine synthetase n=1 Tax=Streptomyces pseudovenezuelae TaxID=67350 RepID=A0ABT6M0Z0_9ACTN|nr:glutamine synthetase family protein [Streptomyces pseudovenezuelae]MDH6222213.1 glutamine synthetase [Streptomyces pseudovenezuelae]
MTDTLQHHGIHGATFEVLRDLVERGAVDTVMLAVPDMQGRLKGRRFGADHFLHRVVPGGSDMCAYVFATDVDMRPLDGFALSSADTAYGDVSLLPDPNAVYQLGWMPRTALVYADAIHDDGQPVNVAPRQILKHQLDRLAARGIMAWTGLETEFVLSHADAGDCGRRGTRPVATRNLDYALAHPRVMTRFFEELAECLAGMGWPVEAIKTESAHGQVEVTFPYGDPLRAADLHLLFKHAVRTIAEQAGLVANFMAAPATGVGSSCHIHLSLTRDGVPLFAETGGRMPDKARHAIGGLLDILPHLALLYAPTSNSYKRYVPGTFAPTTFTWGRDNRTCAIRVVGRGNTLHLENRLPGADTNPYLALAAVLAASLAGIDHKVDPPPPYIGSAFDDVQAPPMPGSLEEALAALPDCPLPASDLLTPDVVAHYTNAARHELAVYRTTVTDLDLHRGLATA